MLQAQRILPLGDGNLGNVNAMVVHDGQLILGGNFSTFLGHQRKHLIGWDGVNFHDHADGFSGIVTYVNALKVYNGELIAAGRESGLGNIARWDGTAWQPMGAGLSAIVNVLCVADGELYAGGNDSLVSRWDGTSWVQMGGKFNGPVNAIEVHEGVLVAGGSFDHDITNQVELRHLAALTTNGWAELANGLNNTVWGLLSTPGGLVVAGGFNARGDGVQSFPHWTIFDGAAFSEPTDSIPGAGEIRYVCAHPEEGFLLGTPLSGPALWVADSGTTTIQFSSLRCAAEFNGEVYVGGISALSYVPVRMVGRLVEGTDHASVDAGGIMASLNPSVNLFQGLPGQPGFRAPKEGMATTIWRTQPWVTGMAQGVLHSAATDYMEELTCGPNADVMDATFLERYFQVWKLGQDQIAHHAQHWNDPGYVVPYAIASWPGNGDMANGEPGQLAPYADLNGNGTYEPASGEYPLIRGDQAVYSILHSLPDPDSLHPSMKLDIHVMCYAFADPANADLYNTVFTNYRIVNRGTLDYEDARFSAFTDLDIGYYGDDMAGCDSLLNLSYGYNGDDIDEDAGGSIGYGADLPAQGMVFLNRTMSAHRLWSSSVYAGRLEDAIYGTLVGQPFTQLGYPTHFQNLGGDWDDFPHDISTVSTTDPFTFNAGDTLCVDLAFPFARVASGDRLESVAALLTRAQALHTWYDAQDVTCGVVPDIITGLTPHGSDVPGLFPNPATDRCTLIGTSAQAGPIVLSNATGQMVRKWNVRSAGGRIDLDLSGVESGVYLLHVVDRGSSVVRKLVVSR